MTDKAPIPVIKRNVLNDFFELLNITTQPYTSTHRLNNEQLVRFLTQQME